LETRWQLFDDKMLKSVKDKLKKDVFEYVEEMADLHEPIACEFYGQALAERDRMEEAIPYYDAAARYERTSAAKTLAKYYMEKGDWEKAEEYCRLAKEG